MSFGVLGVRFWSRYFKEVVDNSWGLSGCKVKCPVCYVVLPKEVWTKVGLFSYSFFSFLFFFFFCSSPAAAAITAAAITAAAAAAAVAAVTVTAAAAAAAAVTVAAAAAAAADFFVALFCLVWPFSRLFSSPLFYAVR